MHPGVNPCSTPAGEPALHILVLHGPNLNLLGTREPDIYGSTTLDQINQALEERAQREGVTIECKQSNHEGELVDWIQQSRDQIDGLLINPAAYTHTSVAVRDALLTVGIPVVEVHLSNTHAREEFRKESLITDVAKGCVMGFGAHSYLLGLEGLVQTIRSANP